MRRLAASTSWADRLVLSMCVYPGGRPKCAVVVCRICFCEYIQWHFLPRPMVGYMYYVAVCSVGRVASDIFVPICQGVDAILLDPTF